MTPLILLPGMMCDARLFQPQIDALSGHIPLMTMPMGGHDTMQALAAELLSCAPPRFAIAGLSMGGILAMEVVRQAKDRVTGLALMDTNPLAELDEVKTRRAPQIAAAEAGELYRVMREEMKPNYLTDGPRRGAILDLCMDMAMGLGPQVFINQSKALRDRIDQTETLRTFAKPTLILCGRDDQLCPVERHQLMHELIPHSTLEIIENAGHLPTLEQPEETTAALSRWLEAL
ncbi:alpha/beta fold hydrolase [Actibacterium pelagium]|uniref:Hydrolase n=1 Tax=Actibacterium pelagium TaxID=2029103 RepID=A0A917ACX7_9RHOB|nr:alpha/beta fold hydrolase [Actibacterium pelagium]GGE44312.1 hydrolase [Actibacterium pelagium]